MVIRINVDRSYESANWIKSVRDSNKADKYKKKNKKLKKSNDLPELMTLLAAAEYLFKQGEISEEWVTGFVPPEKRHYHPEGQHKGPREGRFSIIGTEVDQEGNPLAPAGVPQPQPQAPTEANPAEAAHLEKLRAVRPDLNEDQIKSVAAFVKGLGLLGNTPENRVEEIAGTWLDEIDHEGFVDGQNVGLGAIEDRLDVWSADSLEEQAEALGKTLDDVLEEMGVEEEDRDEWRKSPWGLAVKRSAECRQGIAALLNGEDHPFFAIDERESESSVARHELGEAIKSDGGEAIWDYIEKSQAMGSPAKPVGAVAASPLNCNPSGDCKDFCYAYNARGRWPNIIMKSEFLEWAVNNDPKRFAAQVAKDFVYGKGKVLFDNNRALRFFDRGEGSEAWAKVIYHVNRAETPKGTGIRVHVFSKRPAFLNMVAKENIRLLSVDQDNPEIAEGNDLPIAFVFTGKGPIKDRRTGKVRTPEERQAELDRNLSFAEKYKDRIQVVLPVRDLKKKDNGATAEDIKQVRAIQPSDNRKHLGVNMCPIDDGRKKTAEKFEVKPTLDNWTCANCDMGGDKAGLGCYNGQTTDYETFKISETPAALESMSNEDLTALTVLQEDSNTFQQFLSVDKVKDMIRGVGNIYRRDLSPRQRQAAAEESGVANGHWKAENEEAFTEALEEELHKGHEDIQKAVRFGTGTEKLNGEDWKSPFRKWMRTLYLSAKSSPSGKSINPKLAQVLEGSSKVQKSDDFPELMTLLTAVEYLAKQEESEWARFEDWTWKLPETQKYRHDRGKHVGPHGGKYDVIGYEITADGAPIGPGMVTGAGAPRGARKPVDPDPELPSGLQMVPIEEYAKGLEEISGAQITAQTRQAYVSGLGANDPNDTPLQPNVAVYKEVENEETGEVEKSLVGVTTGDGHWVNIGTNTDVLINTNMNGKVQATLVSPKGKPVTKYSWSWSASSSRSKFAKVNKLIKSGIIDKLAQRAASDISSPQRFTLEDTSNEDFSKHRAMGLNTIQRSAMVAALIFHTARRPGSVGSKSDISVPDGDKLMTGGGKVSTAKGLAAVRKVKPDVSIVKSDLLASKIRGEGKDAAVSQFSVKTFGISTLQKRHIVPQSDGSVMLSFVGKSGKVNHAPVTDPVLAKKLTEMSGDKKLGDEDYIFSAGAWGGTGTPPLGDVNPYIRGVTVDALPNVRLTARNFRTLHANEAAAKLIGEADIPTTYSIGDRTVSSLKPQEFMESVEAVIVKQVIADTITLKDAGESPLTAANIQNITRLWIQRRQDRAKMELAEDPSDILGNDPGTCLGNYIDPDLFDEWDQYNELETEELEKNITSISPKKFNAIAEKLKELKKKGWSLTTGGEVTYKKPKRTAARKKKKK